MRFSGYGIFHKGNHEISNRRNVIYRQYRLFQTRQSFVIRRNRDDMIVRVCQQGLFFYAAVNFQFWMGSEFPALHQDQIDIA